MTKRSDLRITDGSDSAWRAFVDADARLCAPPDLEERVWQAVQSRRVRQPSSRLGRLAALSVAAGAALSVVPVIKSVDEPPAAVIPARPVSLDTLEVRRAVVASRPVSRERKVPRQPGPTNDITAPVLMTLAADPLQETEVLRVVRLRLPREALQALGLAVLEPEAQGSIDVDVVVGEDGLAREIRQMRAGQE